MANANTPFGLRPVRHLQGVPWNGKVELVNHDSGDGVAIYVGDAVKLTGTGDVTGTKPVVAQCAATDAIAGVCVGRKPKPTNLALNYVELSVDADLYITIDPFLVYECQEDSIGGALTKTHVSSTCDLIIGTGNATTGISQVMIDSSVVNTTASQQVKLLRLVARDDNALGSYAKWEVLIQHHQITGDLAAGV